MPRFTPKKKSVALLMGLALSVGAYGCFFFSFYPIWHRSEQIAHYGGMAVGLVIQKQPNNHQSVQYEYSVEGTKYFGTAPAGMSGLPPYDQIKTGDLVPVTYWPKRPSESVAGDRTDVYRTTSFLLFALLPGACLLLGGIAAVGLRMGTTFTWLDLVRYLDKKKRPKISE
jgi:hypothetical protein